MKNYVQFYDQNTGKFLGVVRASDSAFIPLSGGNRDWIEFLKLNAADPEPLPLGDRDAPKAATPEEELARKRAAAIVSLLARDDETGLAVRIFFEAIIFLFNNRFEALGQPRLLQSEIFAYIANDPELGNPKN